VNWNLTMTSIECGWAIETSRHKCVVTFSCVMGRKDDILNSNLGVQSKGLYVQIVGGMNAKCSCLLAWYMYILHPLLMTMVYLVFKTIQAPIFKCFCIFSNGKLGRLLNLCISCFTSFLIGLVQGSKISMLD
jgi:hypothetical protein